MTNKLVSQVDHGNPIGQVEFGADDKMQSRPVFASQVEQNFRDDLVSKLNTDLFGAVVLFSSYAVADVPTASENEDGVIIVTDEVGGRTLATSDGANWLRVSDGAVIS